jgi:heme/copper-type cytochrome/quinol oxidase subunit 2
MFYNDVEQYQWVFAALVAGVAVALIVVLTYFPFWRKRSQPGERPGGEETSGQVPLSQGMAKFIPWVLALIVLGTLIFGVVYTIRSINQTPDW